MKPKAALFIKGNLTASENMLSSIDKDNLVGFATEEAFDLSEAVIIHGDVTVGTFDASHSGIVAVTGNIMIKS